MPAKLLVKTYEYEPGEASVLGEGNYSKVRLCTDRATGSKVAVKIMSVELLKEERAENQVRREVSIARVLDHPNVVKMFDFVDDGKTLYVVLEYVDGGDMASRVAKAGGRLPEAEARKVFQQLVVGLRYCHVNHRIAHRDLKLENMLFDLRTGLIKISDFGLANVAKPATDGAGPSSELMQTVCGTVTHAAPEVLKEAGYDGMTADVWSCGVILFQLLTGDLPFNDENISVLYNKIERAEYRIPREAAVAEGAADLIRRLLTPDCAQRITLDQIIRHPWFAQGFDESSLSSGVVVAPIAAEAAVSKVATAAPAADVPDDGFSLINTLLANSFYDIATAGAIQQNAKRYNVFVRGDITNARQHFVTAFVSLPTKTTINEKGSAPNEIKGFRPSTKGLMTFSVTLSPTICPSLTLATFKLGRGDVPAFDAFARDVTIALGDKAASAIAANPER